MQTFWKKYPDFAGWVWVDFPILPSFIPCPIPVWTGSGPTYWTSFAPFGPIRAILPRVTANKIVFDFVVKIVCDFVDRNNEMFRYFDSRRLFVYIENLTCMNMNTIVRTKFCIYKIFWWKNNEITGHIFRFSKLRWALKLEDTHCRTSVE